MVKKYKKIVSNTTWSVLFSLISFVSVFGQTQTIRGLVTDQDSQYPMVGVAVVILDTDPIMGAVSDIDGQYVIDKVPVGRVGLKFSFAGYKEVVLSQQLLEAGKQLILNVSMEEDIQMLDDLVISAEKKQEVNNEANIVSARTFDVQETRRYAGTRNDVARMAANYAGVSNADDSRNDIVIRGNSPSALLWRLEGLDIPGPNHFNSFGSTGGPVGMLNNNNLSNSDFITSAFPASYGNTVSGVFDLEMRKGNGFTHEYMGQVGFNGFELGAEGPFSKKSNASYMANFRYSTLGIFKALGVEFGTGAAVPQYQDLTFKLDFPAQKAGSFSLFGVGGASNIHFEPDQGGNLYSVDAEDLKNNSKMGVIGLKHTFYLTPETYLSTSLGTSYQYSGVVIDYVYNNFPPNQRQDDLRQNQTQVKYSLNTKWVSKMDARNKIEIGVRLNNYSLSLQDSERLRNGNWFKLTDMEGSTLLTEIYAQHQLKVNDRLRVVGGLHYQNLALNSSSVFEPRVGITYRTNKNTAFNLGYGLHSQSQPMIAYFTQFRGYAKDTNKHLGFTKSHHLSAGVEHPLGKNFRLKTEVYYQHLFEVPIQSVPSWYSILNSGTEYGFDLRPNLANQGFGRNYGSELTLEKFFSNSYYLLLTASLFESKYRGSDGIWRNTAYNNKHIVNLLGGKEFLIGKSGVLTTDIKLTFSGGRFYTPIDLNRSIIHKGDVYDFSRAFSMQYAPYFRTDFKIGFRLNLKRASHEWLVDIQNVFDRKNIFKKYFNAGTQTIDETVQLGMLIVPQYRIYF